MRFIVLIGAMLLGACATGYEPQPNYGRDDLYCWHLEPNGNWRIIGASDTCPPNSHKVYVDPIER